MATDCRESSTALLDEPPVMEEDNRESLDNVIQQHDDPIADESQPKRIGKRRREPTVTRDIVELTKPRIVMMILVTTVASAWIAMAGVTGVSLSFGAWIVLLLGTGLVAGSAGAANQVYERVIDTLMPRTASRPLASGRMSLAAGVALTGAAGLVGTGLLAWEFGALPAVVGAATWALYVLVYTPMKTRTAWNTTVGAIAGALPVFMGYTAAGGQLTDLSGWMLFGVLACWQYPHFMAIAWLYRRQYAEAGFQMTTTVEPTGRSAAWQSIAGTIALATCGVVACLAPAGEWILSPASIVTAACVLAACWPLLKASLRFRQSPEDIRARKMLRWSLVVLPAVLLVMTLRMIGL
ncbi:protoheme IX farnesyltransferase [Aporhodopirellula aestuarii]|uniref:Protoheme IX farnesyltransferase n=1 Tax=Aporhodopirellula aestuarii TaxID=2950107 RepID=A0ABT0TYU0_9BACT|nr:protoheme IX farnesyltransferase [Aporhodopirellula aestuarii]MCM2369766.1 protoheme IX farnesyltransferase [Aporhodopirellula aestuarii]